MTTTYERINTSTVASPAEMGTSNGGGGPRPVSASKAMPVWAEALLDLRLTATQYRVFCYLVWRQGSNGESWPSKDRIAKDLGMSSSTAHRAVEVLVERGYITKAMPQKFGRTHTNRYSVKGSTDDTLSRGKGSTHDTLSPGKGITSDTKRVSPMTPEHYTRTLTKKSSTLTSEVSSFQLAHFLFEAIRKNKPDIKTPNLQGWAKTFDLMIRRDHRTPERIRQVITWMQNDNTPRGTFPGWAGVVLSAAKLREKFDQLEIQMDRPARGAVGGKPNGRDFSKLTSSVGTRIACGA